MNKILVFGIFAMLLAGAGFSFMKDFENQEFSNYPGKFINANLDLPEDATREEVHQAILEKLNLPEDATREDIKGARMQDNEFKPMQKNIMRKQEFSKQITEELNLPENATREERHQAILEKFNLSEDTTREEIRELIQEWRQENNLESLPFGNNRKNQHKGGNFFN